MTFTTLPQLSNFIKSTHCEFAGTFISDTLTVLGQMNADMIAFPAMTGATFEAMTDPSHGELHTNITINKLPSGAWEYIERVVH